MRIGLIGFQNSGKTTVFNALTGLNRETVPYSDPHTEPGMALFDVRDPRIVRLSKMYKPKKTIHAQIECVDFAGFSQGDARNGAFSSAALSDIRSVDALAPVIRNFSDEIVDSTQGPANPQDSAEHILTELILADLVVIENRLEKIELSYKRGVKDATVLKEEKLLHRFRETLEDQRLLSSLTIADDDLRLVRGFSFLTLKPVLFVLNSGEDRFGNDFPFDKDFLAQQNVIEFCGTFEMELAAMSDAESAEFMEDFGLVESARDRLAHAAYQLLGFISFFTVGEDEVRAWTIRKGDNALTAAGRIHSDLARGFIRAECFHYDELISAGSEKGVRENGKFRLEGKDYMVKDGDILHIRFNV